MTFDSIQQYVQQATDSQQSLSAVMIDAECEHSHRSKAAVMQTMTDSLHVMQQAVKAGMQGVSSPTGLTGGEAPKIAAYLNTHTSLSGAQTLLAVQNAVATNEVNASMGVICATPTAGSSGTIPGVLFSLEKTLSLNEAQMVRFLFTCGGVGMVIAKHAMIAGATGGCQAEVGSASAMAAAAAVEAAGGTPQQSSEAIAMALSNLLGLVCDPVAGLVELPCVKRNAIGAGNALIAADMALAGCVNRIPADEVIAAMKAVGVGLPSSLRETGRGGLAATPTGVKMRIKIFGQDMSLS